MIKRYEVALSTLSLLASRIISGYSASGRSCGFDLYYATAATQQQPVKHGFGKDSAKKKGKQVAEGEVSPKLQRVIEMLMPLDQQQSAGGGAAALENDREYQRREQKHVEHMQAEFDAWAGRMEVMHRVQRAALRALPAELRAKAEEPDLSEFPHNRQMLFDTPPVAYGGGGAIAECNELKSKESRAASSAEVPAEAKKKKKDK